MRVPRGKTRLPLGSLIALAFAAATPWSASATSIGITFTSTSGSGVTGSNSIAAAPGDTLTATVSMAIDALGVSSYGVSLKFDMDFGDELTLLNATELLPAGFTFNLTPGCESTQQSSATQEGNVLGCEAGTFGLGPVSTTVDIFTVAFQVTANVATDGSDMETFLGSSGFDGVFDNAAVAVTPTSFGTAAVNLFVPEPTTGLLLTLSLLGLVVVSRKDL